MRNLLRAADEIAGLPRQKVAGLASKNLLATLRGQLPEDGYGAKLLDFIDSELLKTRRTVMGDHPKGGQPAVIDIWANRDVGKIDDVTLTWIRETFGDAAADQIRVDGNGIGETDYEYGSKFYNDLAKSLNKAEFDGGNWTPLETQAVGWMTMQKVMGKVPEFPSDIFDKNTLSVPIGLKPDEGSPLANGAGEILPQAARRVAYAIAKLTGTKIRNVSFGEGSYLGAAERVMHIELFGSVESRLDFAAMIGHALQQTETILSRPLKSGDVQGLTLREKGGAFGDHAAAKDFMAAVKTKMNADLAEQQAANEQLPKSKQRQIPAKYTIGDGFQTVVDNGTGGVRLFSNQDGKWTGKWGKNERAAFEKAVNDVAGERGFAIEIHTDQYEVSSESNDWQSNSDGENYRNSLLSRGRDRLAGRLALDPELRILPHEVRAPADGVEAPTESPPTPPTPPTPPSPGVAEEGAKLKLRADRNEGGFLNADLLQGAADFGRKVYERGMDFGRWATEMVRHLGEKIAAHLKTIWDSIIAAENALNPGRNPAFSEGGALGSAGGARGKGFRLGKGKPIDEPPSAREIEDAANDKEKMRGHIGTVKRMVEVSPTVKEKVESMYSPITLKEVTDRAQATVDQLGIDQAGAKFALTHGADADTLALGHAVALRLDATGRYDDAATVRDSMAERLTTPAQSLWFVSTIAKTSPEGLIREAQKLVTESIKGDPKKMKLVADVQALLDQIKKLKDGPTKTAAINTVLKQLGNVNIPGEKLSPAIVDDLIKQNQAGTLTDQSLGDAIAKGLKIPKVDAETIARIKAAQAAYARAVASGDPIMTLRRGAEMMDSVYGLVPKADWGKVRAAATISMILHGKLPVRIAISNGMRMAGQVLVDTIENIPRDIGNIARGRRTITADQLAAVAEGLKEPRAAFRSGFDEAKARGLTTVPAFREGVRTLISLASMTTRGIQEMDAMSGRNSHVFSSRFGKLAEDTVTLVHNVIPLAFWKAGYNSSLIRQMRVAGVDVPTQEMVANARIDANKAIFQNETVGYHVLVGIRKALDLPTQAITKGKYGFGTATIPFAKVPTAILAEGATWTPLGFIKAGWEAIGRPLTGQEFRPKEVADAMIKAAIGTGSMVMTGYWLAKLGVITGGPDEDKNLNAMMQSLGWGKYKINLTELKRRFLSGNFHTKSAVPEDGDLIVNYNWAEPIAFGIAMGADLAHSAEKREFDIRKGKITAGAAWSAISTGLGSILDNPMVQGLQHLMSSAGEGQYERMAADVVGNVPGNFIPSLVRQTGQYMDNTVRETRGKGPWDQEAAQLIAQIPGLSQRYPPRYDVFGEAVHRQNYGKTSLLNTFFNPAQVSRFKANPEVRELMKIWEATAGSSAAFPKGVDTTITITRPETITRATPLGRPTQIRLDNQQLATYQRYVGQLSAAAVTRIMASPAWAAGSPEQRASTVTDILGAVNRQAKHELFGDTLVKVSPGSLTSPPALSGGINVWDVQTILQSRMNPRLKQLVQPGANN
jgi:hypothetical protein